ncbi:MAG: hypothetical protein WCC37_25160 [Candidatus Sulfotelmatobacter sp.]
MSSTPITPDIDPTQGASAPSMLSQTIAPQTPQYDPSQEQQTDADTSGTQAPQVGGRLRAILSAIASVGSTAMAGVPAGGRPSFAGGLGQGARAGQAAQAVQQDVKFKDFDSQVRAATLHAQDQELQLRTQAQQDAHQRFQDDQSDYDEAHGIQYDTVPNTGDAAVNYLKAQTQGSGSASIPPGTHLSADGKSILIPKQSDDTQTALLQKYNTFAPVYGLPSLPQGAQFVPQKFVDILTHAQQGYDLAGHPINHDNLPSAIASLQTQRDALAAKGGQPAQLQAADNTLGILKANLKALDDHAASVEQNKKAADVAAETSPDAIKGAAAKAKAVSDATQANKIALQDNAASNKPQPDNTELNAVAFDPSYQNPDGSMGANVVMSKSDAAAKGLSHYKADPAKLNATVAGFNDVQNKINMLAQVANDPSRMGKVQPDVAAALMESGDGVQLGAFGTKIDTTKINANLYATNMEKANQATRDYVTALLGAHEAITQLPRLQTFGQSSRMTQQQMEAAQKLLPQPGDAPVARQKMMALQQMLNPLRKQVPHMPGAEQIPSWLEKQGGQ